jgi:multimeric flavodoxin WrbA
MKVLMICGSNRRNGNTHQILDLLAKTLTEQPPSGQESEVEIMALGQQQLKTCTGCRACFDKGEERCPLKDDLLPILARMQAADLLVIASPVYVSDVSGLLKNWIDRLAFLCHRPALGGKPVYLIATTGSSPAGSTLRTMQGALITWGARLRGSSSFIMGALMDEDSISQRYGARIRKAAVAIRRELADLPQCRPNLVELIVFKIQSNAWRKAKPESLDHRYWQKNGWLEPSATYFVPHKNNIFVSLLAQVIGPLVAFFVS